MLGQKAAEVGKVMSGVDGAADVKVQALTLVPQVEVAFRPRAGAAGRRHRGHRARHGGDDAAGHEGRGSVRRSRRSSTSWCGARRKCGATCSRCGGCRSSCRTAATRRSARWPTCASCRRRTRLRARADRGGSTSPATCAAATSAPWPATSRRRWRACSSTPGYHPEVLGEYAARAASQRRLLLLGRAVAGRHPAGAARRFRLGAAGGARGADHSVRVDRRRRQRVPHRWRAVARIAGRLRHRARDRGAQRHHAGQPLPSPRTGRGRAVRHASWRSAARRNGWRRS